MKTIKGIFATAVVGATLLLGACSELPSATPVTPGMYLADTANEQNICGHFSEKNLAIYLDGRNALQQLIASSIDGSLDLETLKVYKDVVYDVLDHSVMLIVTPGDNLLVDSYLEVSSDLKELYSLIEEYDVTGFKEIYEDIEFQLEMLIESMSETDSLIKGNGCFQ